MHDDGAKVTEANDETEDVKLVVENPRFRRYAVDGMADGSSPEFIEDEDYVERSSAPSFPSVTLVNIFVVFLVNIFVV